MEILPNTFILKGYIHSAAIFGGICHPFRRALSSVVSLYSATSVDPEIIEPVSFSLCSTEADFLVTRFLQAYAVSQIVESHLISFKAPGMGEYRVWRSSIAVYIVFGQTENTVLATL